MDRLILLILVIVSCNCFGQTLSIGRTTNGFWNPFDTTKIEDYEYHPKQYCDSVIITLDDIQYLDTTDYKLYFTDSGYAKISSFRASIHPKPIIFAIDGKPILGCWIIMPVSSFSCNWITCVTNWSEKYIEIQLGYPETLFKYSNQDFIDPRKNKTFIEYFVKNNKIKQHSIKPKK
ncbi:MAG: hypothetical protein GY827_06445 [Cytophagales bacterium]|nr:hypothetical protein [Cytophagales bacterium]